MSQQASDFPHGAGPEKSPENFASESEAELFENERIIRSFKDELSSASEPFIEKFQSGVEELEAEYLTLHQRLQSFRQTGDEETNRKFREEFSRDLTKFRRGVRTLMDEKNEFDK